jgi:hypothetical protein
MTESLNRVSLMGLFSFYYASYPYVLSPHP